MKDERTFGQRLRETRVRAGLSQSDLEDLSGIPKARLSRYENGHVAPSIGTLERLSNALGVSEASLLGDQRAILEAFFQRLYDRGVRISSLEQATTLADGVSTIAQALGLAEEPAADAIEAEILQMATVGEWLDADASAPSEPTDQRPMSRRT